MLSKKKKLNNKSYTSVIFVNFLILSQYRPYKSYICVVMIQLDFDPRLESASLFLDLNKKNECYIPSFSI